MRPRLIGRGIFYRAGRPNRFGRAAGDLWVAAADRALTPSHLVALEAVGHRTGRRTAVPLVLADHAGERYVASMLGERSPWVRNVRAAGGRAVLRHGSRLDVNLVEVPPPDRRTDPRRRGRPTAPPPCPPNRRVGVLRNIVPVDPAVRPADRLRRWRSASGRARKEIPVGYPNELEATDSDLVQAFRGLAAGMNDLGLPPTQPDT